MFCRSLVVGSLVLLAACATRLERRLVAPSDLATVDASSPYLKVHMRDGSLYVLARWEVRDAQRLVVGDGVLYDVERVARDWEAPDDADLRLDAADDWDANVALLRALLRDCINLH